MNKTVGKDFPKRGDVFWVCFDPTLGTEIRKTRPAVILSNNLFNKHLPRLIVVPVTSNTVKVFDFEALVLINGKEGKAMLDQIRAVDKNRLGKKICSLSFEEVQNIEKALKEALALV
jgi:mRNA interferase MazF